MSLLLRSPCSAKSSEALHPSVSSSLLGSGLVSWPQSSREGPLHMTKSNASLSVLLVLDPCRLDALHPAAPHLHVASGTPLLPSTPALLPLRWQPQWRPRALSAVLTPAAPEFKPRLGPAPPPTLDLSAGSQPWRHPSRVSWAFQMQCVHIRSRPVTLRPERGTGGLPQLSWRPESPLLSVGGQVVR